MKNIAPSIRSSIDKDSQEFKNNKKMMEEKLNFLEKLLDKAELGGGLHHHLSLIHI